MKVSVVKSSELDFEKFVTLHRASFTEVIDQNRSSEIQNINHFKWKYFPPAGESKIALIEENDELVSANSMMPYSVVSGIKKVIAWQSCDTATIPKARGKGYFSRCIKALSESLNSGDIFFGYPNGNSIRGFKKLGWQEKGVVPAFIRVLPKFIGPAKENIKTIKAFNLQYEKFLSQYCADKEVTLEKTPAYLNWRYIKHPKNIYSCFAFETTDDIEGILVLRKVETDHFSFTLIMELLTNSSFVRRKCLQFASYWGRIQNAVPVAILQNDLSLAEGVFTGYMPVPYKFLPKRHVLMGMTIGDGANEVFKKKWHVQTGDWDGF